MKYFSAGLAILIAFIIVSCENEKENALNEEIQKRKNQVPQLNNPTNPAVKNLNSKIMTEFTPEQKLIKDKVTAVIYENLEATQAEDIDGILKTIHYDETKKSPTVNGMKYIFENYDLEYKLENVQFLSITEDEAKVLYQQTTRAISGQGFMNTRTVGIHTVKKSKDGKWRIYKTENISTNPL